MPHLVHLVDKKAVLRANVALGLSVVWGGLALCAIAAAVFDVYHWIGSW